MNLSLNVFQTTVEEAKDDALDDAVLASESAAEARLKKPKRVNFGDEIQAWRISWGIYMRYRN
jgi:hypothetical protein